jgi:hypothetical protein
VRELSGRQSAGASAGIRGIDSGIGEAIEGHRGRARREHGDYDPKKLMRRRNARSGQHRSAKSEWESEDRVLPLNHFQRDAQVAEDGHEEIVASRSLSSQFSESRIDRHEPVNAFSQINISLNRTGFTENWELRTEN